MQAPDPRAFQSTGQRFQDKLLLGAIDRESPERGGVLKETVWTFSPQAKKDHHGDYHKVFDQHNFLAWWKDQLLPAIAGQPHLIIMDNASYHRALPDSVPKLTAKKQVLIDYLTTKGVTVEATDTVAILKEKVRAEKAKEKPKVVLLAEDQGHEVLFTPPYHSGLQPIELLWAKLKGNIGRKYSKDTTMKVLKQRLDEEFQQACFDWHESVEGMIYRTTEIAKQFHAEAQQDNDEKETEPLVTGEDFADDDGAIPFQEEDLDESPSDQEME